MLQNVWSFLGWHEIFSRFRYYGMYITSFQVCIYIFFHQLRMICAYNGANLAINRKTLSTRKVSATSGAASVPDEVFHRAKGVQLCNTQAHQCSPAFFADSFFLNKFSSEVIAERASVPPTARVICERHAISVVPVTRVTMTHRDRSFSFYIIGFSREVYLKDYYPSRFCWGLCPCLEWLKL
jgi:hypothetical protein